MAQIEIILEKQLLTIQNREVIASGDCNYDRCAFTFDEAWEGYIMTAVFYQEKQRVYYAVLDNENKCTIPSPALTKATPLYIGVFGVMGNKIITSTMDSISIVEGAVSGMEVDVEPSDTVFAAIIANYQAILDAITAQNRSFEEAYQLLQAQNALLEKLNAFELEPLENRMSEMELTLGDYGRVIEAEKAALDAQLDLIKRQSFLIKNVEVVFDENNECRIDDDRVDAECLCEAYFDAISVEEALGHAVFVESHDGYVLILTTTNFKEQLNCMIAVRRCE